MITRNTKAVTFLLAVSLIGVSSRVIAAQENETIQPQPEKATSIQEIANSKDASGTNPEKEETTKPVEQDCVSAEQEHKGAYDGSEPESIPTKTDQSKIVTIQKKANPKKGTSYGKVALACSCFLAGTVTLTGSYAYTMLDLFTDKNLAKESLFDGLKLPSLYLVNLVTGATTLRASYIELVAELKKNRKTQSKAKEEYGGLAHDESNAKKEINAPGQDQPKSEQQDQLPSEHGNTETTQAEQIESDSTDGGASSDTQCTPKATVQKKISVKNSIAYGKVARTCFKLFGSLSSVFGSLYIGGEISGLLDDKHLFTDQSKKHLKALFGMHSAHRLVGIWALNATCAAIAYSGVCATKEAWKELKAELNKNKEADQVLHQEPVN